MAAGNDGLPRVRLATRIHLVVEFVRHLSAVPATDATSRTTMNDSSISNHIKSNRLFGMTAMHAGFTQLRSTNTK